MTSLAGLDLVVHGPLRDLPRRRLTALVARRGGRLSARPGPSTTHVVLAHATAGRVPPEVVADPQAPIISELTFRRMLGLAPPPPPEPRTFTLSALVAHAKLEPGEAEFLAAYDVIEDVDGHYGFRDLACAREAGRLLADGCTLPEVATAAHVLARLGRRLSTLKVVRAPWGGLVQQVEGRYLALDGQFTLDLADSVPEIEDLVAEAESLAEEGHDEAAERLYAIAMRMDRQDPVLPFNLASIRHARGDEEGALMAFRMAVARDPGFADAWYNVGVLQARAGRVALAEEAYLRALMGDSGHTDALHNLALLLTQVERYEEALPIWDILASNTGDPKEARQLRRHVLLCRMALAERTPPA